MDFCGLEIRFVSFNGHGKRVFSATHMIETETLEAPSLKSQKQ